jgi:hypothetical protein
MKAPTPKPAAALPPKKAVAVPAARPKVNAGSATLKASAGMRAPHLAPANQPQLKKVARGQFTVGKAPALGPDPIGAAIALARKEARHASAKKVMDAAKQETENFNYIN